MCDFFFYFFFFLSFLISSAESLFFLPFSQNFVKKNEHLWGEGMHYGTKSGRFETSNREWVSKRASKQMSGQAKRRVRSKSANGRAQYFDRIIGWTTVCEEMGCEDGRDAGSTWNRDNVFVKYNRTFDHSSPVKCIHLTIKKQEIVK